MVPVKELVEFQKQFWTLYSEWIQQRQAAELGEYGMTIVGRVIRGIEGSNRFLLQVDAVKYATYRRLLCYNDSDQLVPDNIVGLSNIYQDVTSHKQESCVCR